MKRQQGRASPGVIIGALYHAEPELGRISLSRTEFLSLETNTQKEVLKQPHIIMTHFLVVVNM